MKKADGSWLIAFEVINNEIGQSSNFYSKKVRDLNIKIIKLQSEAFVQILALFHRNESFVTNYNEAARLAFETEHQIKKLINEFEEKHNDNNNTAGNQS